MTEARMTLTDDEQADLRVLLGGFRLLSVTTDEIVAHVAELADAYRGAGVRDGRPGSRRDTSGTGGGVSGDELRALAEAAWDGLGEWMSYEQAANPTAVLALLDERDALRAQVERVRALADEWAETAADVGWAAPYRVTWQSCSGQIRAALATEEAGG